MRTGLKWMLWFWVWCAFIAIIPRVIAYAVQCFGEKPTMFGIVAIVFVCVSVVVFLAGRTFGPSTTKF